MKIRGVLGVTGAWLLVAMVWAAQNALRANLQGNPASLTLELRTALIQSLPWVPVTLAVIAITLRFPLDARTWRRSIPIHLAGALAVAFLANLLVVLGFWLTQRRFLGPAALVQSAWFWTVMRLHISFVIYAAIAGMTQAFVYWRRARARELDLARIEGQLARARLDALTAQIRPHFLFNTLHTIGQLWRSGRSDQADAMLDHLGSLFHRVQHTTAHTVVTLADELDLVRAYLAIEQVRFEDRMQVRIEVDEAVLDRTVPPLILQPIVENAVRHGISASSTAGEIVVAAMLGNDRLVLTVRDDGPGTDAASTPGSGTGLRNTRERLHQLYGAAAALHIASDESGTEVRITLPVDAAAAGARSVAAV